VQQLKTLIGLCIIMTLLIRVVKDLRKNSIYIEGLKFKLPVHAMRIN